MTCRKHAFEPIADETVEYSSYVEKRSFAGSQCVHCGAIRGGKKTLIAYELENKAGPQGELPDWLASRIVDGTCTLRAPESIRRKHEAERLCKEGRANGTFIFNSDKADWAIVEIRAPQATYIDRLTELRSRLAREEPEHAPWINRATQAELETAEAITRVPAWRRRSWLPRIWTSLVRANSKQGDAANIARRLGISVPTRSINSQWFYGCGALQFRDATRLEVRGEQCIPDRRLVDVVAVECDTFRIIENRDLAWHHQDGLTFCLDGNPTSAQLAFLAVLAKTGMRPTLWPDADAEGVRIARAIKRVVDVEILGLRTYPQDWGIKLDDEKRAILLQELRCAEDEFTALLREFNDLGLFWEQERIYAEAEIAGLPIMALPGPWYPVGERANDPALG